MRQGGARALRRARDDDGDDGSGGTTRALKTAQGPSLTHPAASAVRRGHAAAHQGDREWLCAGGAGSKRSRLTGGDWPPLLKPNAALLRARNFRDRFESEKVVRSGSSICVSDWSKGGGESLEEQASPASLLVL